MVNEYNQAIRLVYLNQKVIRKIYTMKNKLLNFLISLPASDYSRKVNESGLQSPKMMKTTVFGILTICMLLCGAQDAFAQPANDLCAGATVLAVGANDECTFVVGTNVDATDSGEAAPTCASYSGGDSWFSITVPATGNVTVDLGNAGGFTDSGMSIYSGTCGALTQIECDDDDSADGLFSLIALTGQTPGDVLLVRVWEFGNDNFGEFNICAFEPAPPPPAPANDLCADAIPLTIGGDNVCTFTVGTNESATDSGEAAPSCASYSGGDVWYTVTVPDTGDTLTVDLGNAGGFTDSGMSIYSGTCGALTEIECDDDDSADGLFSMISLTGQTPGDVLYVRVWEFGNNVFGEFNICATTDGAIAVACNGTVDYSDSESCNVTGGTEFVLNPVTCMAAPEIANADGTFTIIGFDIYAPDATGTYLGSRYESATFGVSACDPITIGIPDNLGCNGLIYNFEVVTSINEFAADGSFISSINDPECATELVSFTQYPVLTAVDVTADAATCGTLQIDLVAGDGTVCDTQTQACVADGDVLAADFTMGVTDPLGCSTLTLSSAACAGCVVNPPTCDADAPEFEVDAGDCANDDGDGLATPFTYMPSAGSTENTTAPFITEYIVTDGPGGNIVSVHTSLLDAENAANAQAAADGGTACISAINHDSAEFMTLSGELTGCVIGAPLPQADLTTLWSLVQAAAPGASLDIPGIEALIANGQGGTVDLTALGGPVDCLLSAFCYEISAEVCFANVPCTVAPTCAIAGTLNAAPAAPAVTESTCMMGGTVDCSTAPASVVYIASSDGTGDGSCTTAGEFIEICATAECTGCETGAGIDLTGWEVEDEASNDGSPETSINITSGTLLPGECVTIYSGYTTGEIASPATGTMGSAIGIASDRANCPLWNSGGDTAFLYDGDSQAGATLIDEEPTTADASTYPAPTVTCPTGGGGPGTVSGGSIAATTCPTGSTAEYSTDGGASWSATVPAYDQTNAISVMARCLCDEDGTTASPASAAVTTVPGTCDGVVDCPVIAAPTVEPIFICQGDPDGALTAVSATCEGCEDGSAAMVTWWDHATAQTGTGSIPIATGSTIDASGIIDASLAGMKFLYAQCECGDCTSDRTQLMIVINPAPSIDIDNITDPTCFNAADGSYSLSTHSGTAPYTYTFDPPAGTMTEVIAGQQYDITGLAGGTYNISVTDANGCTDSGSLTITDAPAFDLTVDATVDETCFGSADGSVTVSSTNDGGLSLEYGISPNFVYQPSGTFSGLTTGMYTITVRDANNVNCTVSETVLIGGPGEIIPPAVEDYAVCVGEFIPAGEGLSVFCAQTLGTASNTTSIAITDNDTTTPTCSDVTFSVPAGSTIDEVSIDLAISHTWVGDLVATVTAPDGSVYTLFDQPGVPASGFGCDEDDLSLSFSDAAVNTAADLEDACPADVGGSYQPVDALAGLIGSDPNGTWSLCVTDGAGGDTGAIDLFNINITYNDPSSNAITNIYTPAGALVATSAPFDPIALGLVNNNIVGTYCFMATCSDGVCESPATEVCLTVTDVPEPIEIDGDLSVCANSATSYTALGDENSSYIWSVSGAGNFIQSQDGNTAEIVFGATTDGPFTVSVSETSAANCSTISSTEVTVENQSQLACRSFLNVSLGSDCGADLDASLFIKNAAYGADSYTIVSAVDVETGVDVIATGEGYTANHTYNVMVEHICSGTRCWSTMLAEDKIAPTLECPTTEQLGCTADNKPVWPGDYPTANDNCCDLNSPDFFTYSDSNVIPAGSTIANGFNGPLAPANWGLFSDLGTSNATADNIIITTDAADGAGFAEASIEVPYAGEICFDYAYTNDDPGFDDFLILSILSADGTLVEHLNISADETGSLCVPVAVDDIFGFLVQSDGIAFPTFGEASEAVITNLTYTNSEELVDNSTCGSEFIFRTWGITDCNGNVGESCDQIVFITRPSLADIEFPDDITLECGTIPGSNPAMMQGTDPADLDGLFSDLEDADDTFDEDYPVLEGEDLDEKTCFYVASYEDQHVPNLCGETAKVIRTWTVTDWCTAEQVQDIQIIKLLDTTAPIILNCGGTVDVPAAAGSCEGYYGIPMVDIFEECANPVTVTANGLNIGDEVYIPEGGITLTYIAEDACGNTSFCDVTLNLVDIYGPVAICDANTTVSLSNYDDGLAVVCYETFDDGSYDNCEDDIVIKVKRMGTADDFSNCVDFGCSDAGDTIAVRMRVYDIYLDDYAVAQADSTHYADLDTERRYSECMIQVLVQDKIDAEISCQTRFIECVDSYNDITDLGAGSTSFPNLSSDPNAGVPVYCTNCPGIGEDEILGYRPGSIFSTPDNCPDGLYLTITDNEQLGCGGEGRIFRSWKLFDIDGNQVDNCTEQIRVENNYHWWNPSADGTAGVNDTIFGANGFIEMIIFHDDDLINWPENVTYDCNSGTSEQDVAAILEFMPNVYDIVEGLDDDCAELYLAVNDHYVYDLPDACYKVVREWKIFDDCKYDPNDPEDGGFWSATREVTVIDSTAPTFDDCSDRIFDVTAPNCVEVDQVGCSGYADLAVNATDFCGNDAIVYRWYLDANADGLVDQLGEGNDASGIYPIGTHNIRYEAEDGCGNVAVCEFEFKIVDNKAPTPVCVVLTSTVMPSTGALEIWASDFESGSSCDNCTAYDNLEWRINKGSSATSPPNANSTSVTFDCSNEIISFGAPMDVQVWVGDEAGNWDYCLTQIVFTPINPNDTDHPCYDGPEMLDIEGQVETEDHDMVEMVDVDVSSTTANPFTTGTNGLFSFFGVPAGGNYVVTPEKDINPLNGVTTYDLVLISQHILGVQTLDSPYKIIAADANLSGSVTTLDLVKIRSVILNIDQDFAPNTSWRFVDMDFVFPNPAQPFLTTFPEVISYNNLTSDELATDFVGVKIGDVNGSALPNQLIGSVNRSADGTLIFDTDDIKLIEGNEYTIDFTATDFTDLLGYQYSIEFDTDVMEFVNINAGELNDLTDANFGYAKLNDGIITTSWNSATATTMKDNAVLFSMTFNAKSNGQLSELMSATSKAVKAEAYTTNLDLLDVAIAFNTEDGTITTGESFDLLQNVPNPFRTETVIGFNLEEASSATLQIMDASGKVLKHIEGDFVRGYNEVKLNKLELQGAGVLHYQLDTPTNTATKKMILID